ncbi:MAG: hypothetical protein HYV04_11020 [Deltaproteobacteria bacterium]|nr:hypothetical protein [Deltaproteobacteria bacterium]
MGKSKTALAALLLVGSFLFGVSGAAAETILYRAQFGDANYCHLKFPAIEESTLFTNQPVLKDSGTSDIIDFYGSCDHDPVGMAEVARQTYDYHRAQFGGDS